jgi:hypothetical protein
MIQSCPNCGRSVNDHGTGDPNPCPLRPDDVRRAIAVAAAIQSTRR